MVIPCPSGGKLTLENMYKMPDSKPQKSQVSMKCDIIGTITISKKVLNITRCYQTDIKWLLFFTFVSKRNYDILKWRFKFEIAMFYKRAHHISATCSWERGNVDSIAIPTENPNITSHITRSTGCCFWFTANLLLKQFFLSFIGLVFYRAYLCELRRFLWLSLTV